MAAVVTGENRHRGFAVEGDLIERARAAMAIRLAQRRIFPAAVFRESCWDIMLLCFGRQLEGHALCIKQIRNHLDESNTALLRRIDELEQAGMVRRHRDTADGRRTMVQLTPSAVAAMTRFFDLPGVTDAR